MSAGSLACGHSFPRAHTCSYTIQFFEVFLEESYRVAGGQAQATTTSCSTRSHGPIITSLLCSALLLHHCLIVDRSAHRPLSCSCCRPSGQLDPFHVPYLYRYLGPPLWYPFGRLCYGNRPGGSAILSRLSMGRSRGHPAGSRGGRQHTQLGVWQAAVRHCFFLDPLTPKPLSPFLTVSMPHKTIQKHAHSWGGVSDDCQCLRTMTAQSQGVGSPD